jgi:ubiquinone/menaquinone biosynthesis C-methylase UbiE
VQELPSASFRHVDRATDPQNLVSYLDEVRGLEGAHAYKRQSFAVMGVKSGHAVLDVGCGAGDDLRELAGLVGASGRVVGVDTSETMVQQARTRLSGLPIECYVGDAYKLQFADETFDSCRADRVFQHLEVPRQALMELVRVTRAGGRIAISDPDWGTLVVDAADREVTRRILAFRCDKQPNGWMGRQLKALASQSGLLDVTAHAFSAIITDWDLANRMLDLQSSAQQAAEDGTISSSDALDWVGDLVERARAGRFFSALTGFTVSGRKA